MYLWRVTIYMSVYCCYSPFEAIVNIDDVAFVYYLKSIKLYSTHFYLHYASEALKPEKREIDSKITTEYSVSNFKL